MTEEERALREKAEAATPGRWEPCPIVTENGPRMLVRALDAKVNWYGDGNRIVITVEAGREADAAFIAAANPAAVLALLDAAEARHEDTKRQMADALILVTKERDALLETLDRRLGKAGG